MTFTTIQTGNDGPVVVQLQTREDGAHRLVVDGDPGDPAPAGKLCVYANYRGSYVDPLAEFPPIFKITALNLA